MKVNLYFNYYDAGERKHEIDYCLDMNRKVFDRVILIPGRPTFGEWFEHAQEFPDDINCFCNSDIYFQEIDNLKNIKPNDAYALTRWDKTAKGLKFFARPDSQDAWVFKGVVRKLNKSDFTAGMWGCDNRLAHELKAVGYNVINPSLSIVTVHVHENDNRNYERTVKNTVPPPYHQLKPISL